MTAPLFKELSDKIGDYLSLFRLKKEVECPMCNLKTTVSYDEIFSLMVF